MTVYKTGLAAVVLCLAFSACVPAAPPVQPPDAGTDDACGASALQGLVGQPESVLQTMRFSQPLRVIYPDSAVTMDYSPFRLNILIGRAGMIERVSCG